MHEVGKSDERNRHIVGSRRRKCNEKGGELPLVFLQEGSREHTNHRWLSGKLKRKENCAL